MNHMKLGNKMHPIITTAMNTEDSNEEFLEEIEKKKKNILRILRNLF